MTTLAHALSQLFEPVDARTLAAMRITLGVLLMTSWLLLWPELDLFYAANGVVDEELLQKHWTGWRASHLTGLSGPSLHVAHALGLLVLLAFTAGFATPITNLLAVALLVGLWHRSPWVQNGGDRLLRIWTIAMLFGASGSAWSIDAWLRGRGLGLPPRRFASAAPVRLVQAQIGVVYLATGIEKLGGAAWLDGTAIYYAMSDATFSRAPWLYDPLLATDAGVYATMALTWGTLAWELLFVPFVAWRPTRAVTLLLGVGLHAGIFVTLSVGMFGPASLWAYPAFFPDWPERWDALRARRAGRNVV